MKNFIDRENELQFWEEQYSASNASLIVLYGWRRLGKTALMTHFIQNKRALYFLVTEESEHQNRNAFKDMVVDFTGNALLKAVTVDHWNLIFQTLADSVTDERLIILIDEFQYLGKSNPAFPSIFQKIWDTILKDRNVIVILCGSLISIMESQPLSYSSPLYGRRTGQIKMKQIPFSYYNKFFPDKGLRELIEYYSVTGGVPKYIELFHSENDIYQAISKNVLQKSSFLYDEPNFLLQREVNEVGSYYSLIKTIAAGNQKLGKIAGVLEMKQTGLNKYLKTLIDLDILEREVPIMEEFPKKSKRGLYRIKDNFLLFWFKFIYPNLSLIESEHGEIAMIKIQSNFIDNHVSYVYEEICLEILWKLNGDGAWDPHFERAGRWWDGQNEIDIVALDSDGNNIIFGECKYWKSPIGLDILEKLRLKSSAVEWNRNKRTEYYILFSISGFTQDLVEYMEQNKNVILYC